MLNIVLYEPEIPQNTGNIARTCAVTGIRLHLIKPLGFDISDKAVKRAGLDYWHLVDLRVYENLEDFFRKTGAQDIWLATSKAPRPYTEAQFRDECYLIFGKETAGLPEEFRQNDDRRNRAAGACVGTGGKQAAPSAESSPGNGAASHPGPDSRGGTAASCLCA